MEVGRDNEEKTRLPPAPLVGIPKRQAVPAIRGMVYQAWSSIDAWLRLQDDETVIYLEGAEDFDVVRNDEAWAVQIKNTREPVSLGTEKARTALEAYWTLACNETSRRIDLHYLTTGSIAREANAEFGGLAGIEAWRVAQTDGGMATKIAAYLIAKLPAGSALHEFLKTSSAESIQSRLIRRFQWFTEQPDLAAVQRSVEHRLTTLVVSQNRPVTLVEPIRRALVFRFWEIIVEQDAGERCLTRGDLLRQIAEATHTYLPIPLEHLPKLLQSALFPGAGLLDLLLQKVPQPPMPLLERRALVGRLLQHLGERKTVLITGTVFKGKTTLAQLGAAALCQQAWWVVLSGREVTEVDNLLLALAQRIEEGAAPTLLIIDDLDLHPNAYQAYRASLEMVLFRARASSRSVVLTARGGLDDSAFLREMQHLEWLEVPALDDEELRGFCLSHGCPDDLAGPWSALILASTCGHPKLVQVRLEELQQRGWPAPHTADLIAPSPALVSARQIARTLMCGTVPPPVAEFVYTVAEALSPITRSVAVAIAASIPELRNGGDIVAALAGKWLESLGPEHIRATALLQGAGAEVWSPAQRRTAHHRVFDALRAKTSLSPSEAAALLYHAYSGADPKHISFAALQLQMLKDAEATKQVNRSLQWLTWLALEQEQQITGDPIAASILRSLQFRVAVTVGSNSVSAIARRWREEIERVAIPELRAVFTAMRSISIGISTQPLPVRLRLEAITASDDIPEDLRADTTLPEDITGVLQGPATIKQAMFSCTLVSVRDYEALQTLTDWLETSATPSTRAEFELILSWPAVQNMGAFVQSAWSGEHERVEDWEPWLALLDRIDRYAIEQRSPRFGHEASKARAIILTEYLERAPEALVCLERAVEVFGPSPVLLEQRANTLFHMKDDAAVVEAWDRLRTDPASASMLDTFAYRRAAISAARLDRWDLAEELFLLGAEAVHPTSREPTRFGLMADVALVRASAGAMSNAARMLVASLDAVPDEAAEEGNTRWEAAFRVVSNVCRSIEARSLGVKSKTAAVDFGWASSPTLNVSTAERGQQARASILQAEILRLAATVCLGGPDSSTLCATLSKSRYPVVRWLATQARLALALDSGESAGFIELLLQFDRAVIENSSARTSGRGILEPDEGEPITANLQPERFSSLLVAAALSAGPALCERLRASREDAEAALGTDAPLVRIITSMETGANLPLDVLQKTVLSVSDDNVRVGAAARLLLETPSASLMFQVQQFLLSALTDEAGLAYQRVWNVHVARRFGESWRKLSEHRFQFRAPRTTVPLLLTAIDQLERGTGSLGQLMSAAESAVGARMLSFMAKII